MMGLALGDAATGGEAIPFDLLHLRVIGKLADNTAPSRAVGDIVRDWAGDGHGRACACRRTPTSSRRRRPPSAAHPHPRGRLERLVVRRASVGGAGDGDPARRAGDRRPTPTPSPAWARRWGAATSPSSTRGAGRSTSRSPCSTSTPGARRIRGPTRTRGRAPAAGSGRGRPPARSTRTIARATSSTPRSSGWARGSKPRHVALASLAVVNTAGRARSGHRHGVRARTRSCRRARRSRCSTGGPAYGSPPTSRRRPTRTIATRAGCSGSWCPTSRRSAGCGWTSSRPRSRTTRRPVPRPRRTRPAPRTARSRSPGPGARRPRLDRRGADGPRAGQRYLGVRVRRRDPRPLRRRRTVQPRLEPARGQERLELLGSRSLGGPASVRRRASTACGEVIELEHHLDGVRSVRTDLDARPRRRPPRPGSPPRQGRDDRQGEHVRRLPVPDARPVVRLDVTGGIVGSGIPAIPGSAPHARAMRDWISLEEDGLAIAWATRDVPLVHIGGLPLPYVPYPPTIDPEPGLVVSWIHNNVWDTNFPPQQGFDRAFRYRIARRARRGSRCRSRARPRGRGRPQPSAAGDHRPGRAAGDPRQRRRARCSRSRTRPSRSRTSSPGAPVPSSSGCARSRTLP